MSDNRSLAAIWTAGFVALVAAIFLMSGCIQNDTAASKAFADRCVASGKKFIDTDKQFGMCI